MNIKLLLFNVLLLYSSFNHAMEQEKQASFPKGVVDKMRVCKRWVNTLNTLYFQNQDAYFIVYNEIYDTISKQANEDQLDAWLTMLNYAAKNKNKPLVKKFCRSVRTVFATCFEHIEPKNYILMQIESRALIHRKDFPLKCFKKLDEKCFGSVQIPSSRVNIFFPDKILASLEEFLIPFLDDPVTFGETLQLSLQTRDISEPTEQFSLLEDFIKLRSNNNLKLAKCFFHYLSDDIYGMYFVGGELDFQYRKRLHALSNILDNKATTTPTKIPKLDFNTLKKNNN